MSRARYIIGIDLGTTNCALAYVDTRGRERPAADIAVFEVPQLVSAGEVAAREMLPSFLYLPAGPELPEGSTRLPWNAHPDRLVGEFARAQGSRVPSRLVSSAKSWLCHAGVDREAAILPWGAPEGVPRLSPVEASAEYLRHLRDAWNATRAKDDPAHRLEAQEIVLTVPASFDEAARELTVAAARSAGFERLTLLEEPQAAFYCWIVTHNDGWQAQLRARERILVCDIGGGTTDFSLITVVETPEGPGFQRVAVGDHLMLGGDNIDLALAHKVEAGFGGARLDTEQWSILRHACRTAKERLLSDEPPERWPVSIPGRGSRVIGGSLKAELERTELLGLVLDGFLPFVDSREEPSKAGRTGLQEFGLPFVSDPAMTRHLAAFLRRHVAEVGEPGAALVRPDAILFNGGALTPSIVRQRIVDVVSSWFPQDEAGTYRPRVLANTSLDLAVAIGAAYYGVVRRGGGIRIGGGTARSFYVGFETVEQADRPWLCVVPRDAQEGDEIEIHDHDFDLLMGQPAAFPLASSSVRPQDRPGDLVAADPASILPLPPLVGTMRVGRKAKAERVPVRLRARVTEVGTVELGLLSRADDRRWTLQIQLRGTGASAERARAAAALLAGETPDPVVIEQSEINAGCEAIRTALATAQPQAEGGVARLVKRLEEALDETRDRWPPSALRALWNPLRDDSDARLKTPQHESRWLNLAGYCLRPGIGYPQDDSRMKALWPIWHQSTKHQKDTQCWVEWWVLWRRVAAGLNRSHHDEIFRRLAPFLLASRAGKKPLRPKPEPHELAEMWRTASALERLPAEIKAELGNALITRLKRGEGPPSQALWCLGRVGARVPLYGPANTVAAVPAAVAWLLPLLEYHPTSARESADLAFALSQLASVSGDRTRDLDPELRERVAQRLVELQAPESLIARVRSFQELAIADQSAALGDALPVGLRLVAAEDGV